MAKLTVEVSAEQFAECIQTAYKKTKNRFALPGFRKGKAPLNMIEKMYGVEVFYETAADEAINETYAEAMKESALEHEAAASAIRAIVGIRRDIID